MKYIVQCIKKISCYRAGLDNKGTYQIGDMVTYCGQPTRRVNEAQIYEDDHTIDTGYDDFPWDYDVLPFESYFKKVPIKIVKRKKR